MSCQWWEVVQVDGQTNHYNNIRVVVFASSTLLADSVTSESLIGFFEGAVL